MNQPSLLSLLNKLSNQKNGDLFAANNIENINSLLEAVSSEDKMQYWAGYHQLSVAELHNNCLRFLIKHIQNNVHDSYCVLFIDKNKTNPKLYYQRRYRLLMNVFHPDKGLGIFKYYGGDYGRCAPLITTAYKQIREDSRKKDQQNLRLVKKNSDLSKKVDIDSLSGGGEIIKVKLTKSKKPKQRLHLHLVMSILFICFAFLLFFYIFIDKNTTTGFYKKTVIVAENNDKSKNNNSNLMDNVGSQHEVFSSSSRLQ